MKTTCVPYSREKNKYAVGTEWAGVLNVCGALNRIVRNKSKLVCKLLLSEELDGGHLLLRLVPSNVLLCGLLKTNTQEGRTPQAIADGVGKQNICIKHLW